MKRYVVGFMFDEQMKNVLLIVKDHPEWQAGKLNGIGGHIETGETPVEAMVREFYEEAGVMTEYAGWVHVLTLQFEYATVDFFAARSTAHYVMAETKTSEPITRWRIDNITTAKVIENIPALIELSVQRLADVKGVPPCRTLLAAQNHWTACETSLPDSDQTVLVFLPDSNEPVWLGYHDGEQWWSIDQFLIKVSHWMEMPEPPSS
jgi:8-oxo-dGTP diphosphatase